MKVTVQDKPWMNVKLKKLKRQRQRVYNKSGRSIKYKKLKEEFDLERKKAIKFYEKKIVEELKEGKRTSTYKILRRLDPQHDRNKQYCIQSHTDEGLSPEESVEKIARYFVSISEKHEELKVEELPPNIREELEKKYEVPKVEEFEVYNKIVKAKKPETGVDGDVPKKLVKEFAVEYAKPMTIIMNKISETGTYPRQWVKEYQTAIPKQNPVVSERNIRLISSTAFFSKCYEAFIKDWLMPILSPHLEGVNYGGMKHASTNHYMLLLLQFIHEELDQRDPHTVLLAGLDVLQAFNNVSHILVIQDLVDMRTPGWLLRILISFLSRRNMTLRFNGVESKRHFLPASTPQGIYLGVIIFLVKFQGAFLRPAIPRNDLSFLSDPSSSNAQYEHLPCHSKDFTAKYVDDSVKAVSISLKHCLEEDTHQVRPLTFHRRTGHKLKENHNSLQMHLDRFMEFIKSNEFQVNEKKSSVMMFRRSKLTDFHPVMKIHEEGEELELVRESKILGFMLSDSLKWDSHVQYICAKASKRIWILMRLIVWAI